MARPHGNSSFDSGPDAAGTAEAIIHTDLAGVITEWNATAAARYGYTREEALGQHINIIVPRVRRRQRETQVEKLLKRQEEIRYGTTRRSRHGRWIDVHVTKKPIRDDAGEIVGVSTIERDITSEKPFGGGGDQMIARDAAAESAGDILDAMREAVLLVSLEGVVLLANPAATALADDHRNGVTGEAVYDAFPLIVTEDDWADSVAALLDGPGPGAIELASVHVEGPAGEPRSLSPVVSLVEPATGTASSAILTLRDVTALRRYQANLRALTVRLIETEEEERLRISRFVHDMIIQNLSLSRIKLAGLVARLEGIDRGGESEILRQVQSLLDDTIDQSRSVMSDLTPPLLYEVGLSAALEELAAKFESQHGNAILVVDEGFPLDLSNPLRGLLFQSTRELIWNALKHAGPCTIRVRLGADDTTLRVVVEDDGRGFNPAVLDIHTAEAASFGLFNVRERLFGLGGNLDIRTREGDGTTASLTLPRAARVS